MFNRIFLQFSFLKTRYVFSSATILFVYMCIKFYSKGYILQEDTFTCIHHCLEVLPDILCRAPQESLNILNKTAIPTDYSESDRLFDQIEFQSTLFQRPYQYLKRHDTNSKLTDINPKIPEGNAAHCLTTLLRFVLSNSTPETYLFSDFLAYKTCCIGSCNSINKTVSESNERKPVIVLNI